MLRAPGSHALGPEDLAACQTVFDKICADAKVERSSVDALILASTVLFAFQHGAVDCEGLLAAVRRKKADFLNLGP